MSRSVSKSASDASSGDSISGGSDSFLSDTEDGSKTTVGSCDAEKDQLAQKETRDVFLLRVLVVIVLLLAAVAVSIVVFFITRNAEVDEYETQYTALADTVLRAFEDIVTQKMGAISSVGVAAIAHGVDSNLQWPFLTLSSFQERSATARSLSGAVFVSLNPVVSDPQRAEWEKFLVENSGWIPEGHEYQEDLVVDGYEKQVERLGVGDTGATSLTDGSNTSDVRDEIFYVDQGKTWIDPGPGPYLPMWQTSPVFRRRLVNENIFRTPMYAAAAKACLEEEAVVLGGFDSAPAGDTSHPNRMTSLNAAMLSIAAKKEVAYQGDPMTNVFLPVFDSFKDGDKSTKRTAVAVILAVIHWASYFKEILPPNVKGLVLVLDSGCDGTFTYRINGLEVRSIGVGDHHRSKFDDHERSTSLYEGLQIAAGTRLGLRLNYGDSECRYDLRVYPSQEFYDEYNTTTPIIMTSAVAMVFVFTAVMFLVYDRLVERRQRLVLMKAAQSSAIVSSLFPKNVRDRMMQETGNDTQNNRLKSFLKGDSKDEDVGLQPIADLFPHCTVLFADISGFTAWSSTREPAQVFTLLQTLYQAFDVIARRRRVFKVETIGDSYVAVTGLPEPQEQHVIIMAKFTSDCMKRMNEVTKELEVKLGPDTGDLSMRFGLHSGPVTAGVLRGERSRFQLFGDTVNTAARMESLGERNKIQVSQSTADLLTAAGKSHWLKSRLGGVTAKGKGVLNTFWLNPSAKKGSSSTGSSSETSSTDDPTLLDPTLAPKETAEAVVKQERLVDWMVELLLQHVKKIIARRTVLGVSQSKTPLVYTRPEGTTCLDEVKEVIMLPKFDAKAAALRDEYKKVQISETVKAQLREYVSIIASTYRGNPFHNFEHACHVTMSVSKLLTRIVAPDLQQHMKRGDMFGQDLASHLHDYTHGITSDPLAVLAIELSALIHDADHRGVSNGQLIKEEEEMGVLYKNKSVAEQNSLDLSWDLLMSEPFGELRSCLFANQTELLRFRQVLVNVVLATDIFDKELNDLRKQRWNKAFSTVDETIKGQHSDLKATIVIEHIIQASDVAHTMQHWHVYRKWNERLFTELYSAFRAGRMGMDPSVFWYKGELSFFDNYIIPLAKKLKECNVFGVSSDEYLNYALQNRAEWEQCGEEVIEEMMNRLAPDRLDGDKE